MTPSSAYRKLNKFIWMNRLPKASVVFVNDGSLPSCYGITFQDSLGAHPVILLNAAYRQWGRTLVHESLHIAEPTLSHGKLFDALVELYWRRARTSIPGLRNL